VSGGVGGTWPRSPQPVEKLLAELMREHMSLTAQSLFLSREIPAIKRIKVKNSKRMIEECIINKRY
jgi:hypothetical protein